MDKIVGSLRVLFVQPETSQRIIDDSCEIIYATSHGN